MQPISSEVLSRLDTPPNRIVGITTLAVMFGAMLVYVVRTLRRRRALRRLHSAITTIGVEHRRSVLLPDGNGGATHVDYLLLTPRGILVIDQRDVRGNIYGGDQMTQWVAMSGARRHTFPNPQHALYDRVAAVKQLVGDTPVEGRVLFTHGSRFPRGLPRWTLLADSLRAEFPPSYTEAMHDQVGIYREGWTALVAALNPSPLRQRPGFIAEVFRG
jgi:hypothetical protein